MASKRDAALELYRRRQARSRLLDFICFINDEYIVSDFSREVCAELERFIDDVIAGNRPVLIICAPPQHGKSDIVSRYLPSFIFGNNPDFSIGGLSYGKNLASDMNRDVQRIMMSEEYAVLFPKTTLNKKRVVTIEVEAKRNSETFEICGKKGRYISQGVGGPLTGKRLDIGIIDDPIKNAQEALSQTVKKAVWDWYITTFQTRLSQKSGQIIMATRWATDDLPGRIIDATPNVRVLKFPAINDAGEALVPELHSIEKLLQQKALMSEFFWSALYQQEPVPLGGNIIKQEWWKYYSILPDIKYKVIFADTAQKTKETNDYSVFQCWGYTQDRKAYLIDQIRGKWEAPELLTQARAFWNKHKFVSAKTRSMSIEDKASGTGLIQTLKREGIPIKAIQRGVDKVSRAFDAAPYISSGYVYLPEQAEWLSDYLIELAAFPNGEHDDQCDPTFDAVMEIDGPAKSFYIGKA